MTKSSHDLPDADDIAEAVADEDRLDALQGAIRSGHSPSAALDKLAETARRMFNVPVVLISLVDKDVDIVKAQLGVPDPFLTNNSITAKPSFCQLTIAQSKPVVINDALLYPTLRLFPAVSEMGVRAHLGIPLMLDGQAIGNCCVIDYKPREWTDQDIQNLTEIAARAEEEIKHQQAVNQQPLDI